MFAPEIYPCCFSGPLSVGLLVCLFGCLSVCLSVSVSVFVSVSQAGSRVPVCLFFSHSLTLSRALSLALSLHMHPHAPIPTTHHPPTGAFAGRGDAGGDQRALRDVGDGSYG